MYKSPVIMLRHSDFLMHATRFKMVIKEKKSSTWMYLLTGSRQVQSAQRQVDKLTDGMQTELSKTLALRNVNIIKRNNQ